MSEAKSPLKVVRIIDRLIYGGPTRNVVYLTEGLSSRGFECSLVTGVPSEGEGDMTFWAREHGVEPIKIKEMSRELQARDLLVCWKLFRLFQELRPDIVHTHKSKAGAVGRIAAFVYKWLTPSVLWLQPRGVKVVHTYHGHIFHSYYSRRKTSLFLMIERALARMTDCIVTVSVQQVHEIRDVFGVGSKSRFEVIPLGTEFAPAPAVLQFRAEYGFSEQDFLIIAVGRLCEVKNFKLLVDAMALACDDPNFTGKLAIVGDGHLRTELERYVCLRKMEHRVAFTGFQSHVEAIYPACDVAVLSSLNEGTPLTLIEAMSHGRPVITTEVGGYADILGTIVSREGGITIWEHGISVPSGDEQAYARALLRMESDYRLRAEMGGKARTYSRAQFSRERLIEDIAALYLTLCGRDASGASEFMIDDKTRAVSR